MTDLQIFDKRGKLRAFTDAELEDLPADRRAKLDAVMAAMSDVAECEAMIEATQRSLQECNHVMAQVKANIKANSPTRIDAAREWMNTTRGM
jgi:hypothetical protein